MKSFYDTVTTYHALQNAAQSVLPFEISKQSFKGRIVCKEMQPLGDGQTVAGPDQDSVRLFDSFCNKVPVSYVRSLLPILYLYEIAPVGWQVEFPPNLLADTGCVPAGAPARGMFPRLTQA